MYIGTYIFFRYAIFIELVIHDNWAIKMVVKIVLWCQLTSVKMLGVLSRLFNFCLTFCNNSELAVSCKASI